MDHESASSSSLNADGSERVARPLSIRRTILIGMWMLFAPAAVYSLVPIISCFGKAQPSLRDGIEALMLAGGILLSLAALYFSTRAYRSQPDALPSKR